MTLRRAFDLSLYLVTDPTLCAARGVVETAAAAARGGATLVQLRDKQADDLAFVALARALKAALGPDGPPLIVNDRIEVARAAGADGAHIGQEDGDPAEARARIGPDLLLGLSIDAEAQAARVDRRVVDYIGAGPVFPTTTKANHKTPIGVDAPGRFKALAGAPTVAIGGVTAAAVPAIIRGGADGVAVVSAICAAPDPEAAARTLADAVRRSRS